MATQNLFEWPVFRAYLFTRLCTVLAAFALFRTQKRTTHTKYYQYSVSQVGLMRRAQCLDNELPAVLDEMPGIFWLCGSSSEASDRKLEVPIAEFLNAYSCSWDGKHYHWLSEFGYRPNITVSVALPTGPLGLRLVIDDRNEENPRRVTVSAFRRPAHEPNRPLAAERSRRVSIGDDIIALNGRSVEHSKFAKEVHPVNLLQVRPSQLRWFNAKAAFMPLYPLGVLRPLLWLLRAAGAREKCCLLGAILLGCAMSAMSLAICRSTRLWLQRQSSSRGLKRHGQRCDLLVSSLLVVWPSCFFLTTTYSEALYSILAALWLQALSLQMLATPIAIGFLMPLTRGVGAFVVLPAAVFTWQSCRQMPRGAVVTPAKSRAIERKALLALVMGTLPYVGLLISPALGYMAHRKFISIVLGDTWSSGSSQEAYVAGFASDKMLRPFDVLRLLTVDFEDVRWHEPTNSLLDRATLLFSVVFLAWGFRRLSPFAWAFSLVNAAVPPLSGSLMSFTRFFTTAALGGLLLADAPGSFLAQLSFAGGCTAAQLALTWRFLDMSWAG
jgi:hypothetical protein